MDRAFAVGLFAALVAVPALSAPATKRTDGPITPEQLAKSADNLKRIATAMHEYHDAHHMRLPINRFSKEKKPLLSWRVRILPYLGEKKLYEQFKLDEPWDSAHNKTLIEKVPAVYSPIRGTASRGQTFYQVFGGKQGLFRPGEQPNLPSSCPDGTDHTFMVAEAARPVAWTEPADLEFDGETVPALGACSTAGSTRRSRTGRSSGSARTHRSRRSSSSSARTTVSSFRTTTGSTPSPRGPSKPRAVAAAPCGTPIPLRGRPNPRLHRTGPAVSS
jgi:Protein of unknown function (DUF1559)